MTAEFEDKTEHITSTLIDYDTPNGDTSMARTTSLPLAICTRLVLEGHFTRPGLCIPTVKELYEPILKACRTRTLIPLSDWLIWVSEANCVVAGAEAFGHLLHGADQSIGAYTSVGACGEQSRRTARGHHARHCGNCSLVEIYVKL